MRVVSAVRVDRYVIVGALVALAAAATVFLQGVVARGVEPGSDYIEWIAERGQRQQFVLDGLVQEYSSDVPWTLEASPELVAISSTGPDGSFPYYSSNNRQRHGVAAPGEGQDFQDSIGPGETLTFAAGSALSGRAFVAAALKIDNAGNQGVVVQATAALGGSNVPLYIYEGDCATPPATTASSITIEPNDDLKLFCFEGTGPFDSISFTAVSGRYAFKGFEPFSKLYLSDGPAANATVPCDGELTVDGAEVDSVLTAECDAGKTSVFIYINSYADAGNRYLDIIFPDGADGSAILTAVNTWNAEPAATGYAPTQYDPDPLDGVVEFEEIDFCGEIPGGQPTAAIPVCAASVLIVDQDDGTVVRTETNRFYGDPQLIRPR
jgi:hypothetical protein